MKLIITKDVTFNELNDYLIAITLAVYKVWTDQKYPGCPVAIWVDQEDDSAMMFSTRSLDTKQKEDLMRYVNDELGPNYLTNIGNNNLYVEYKNE